MSSRTNVLVFQIYILFSPQDANSNGTVMVGATGAMLVQPSAVPAPPVGAIPVNPVMTMPAGVNPTPSAVGGTVISMETENEASPNCYYKEKIFFTLSTWIDTISVIF